MGCDIHAVVQVRKDGKWLTAKVKNPKYKRRPDGDDTRYSFEREHAVFRVLPDRDYDLFGILANVRNGVWGEKFNYISDSRGLPEDFRFDEYLDYEYCASGEVSGREHHGVWMGDHSHTWVTIKEILDFDWDQTVQYDAHVSPEQAKELVGTNKRPDAYSAWSSNGVSYKWKETYREACDRFWTKWMPVFQSLGQPEDVRIVMGFDS